MKFSERALPVFFKYEPFIDTLTFKYASGDSTKLDFENPDAKHLIKAIIIGFGKRLEGVASLLRRDPDGLKNIISDMILCDEEVFNGRHIEVIKAQALIMGEADPQRAMLNGLVSDLKGMLNYLHPKDKFIEVNFAEHKLNDRDKDLLKVASKSVALDMSNALLKSLDRSRDGSAEKPSSR